MIATFSSDQIGVSDVKKLDIQYLDQRNEVVDAYASHDKLQCAFNLPEPVDLQTGLLKTAQFVKEHVVDKESNTINKDILIPRGFTDIETWFNMPPSWIEWFAQTQKKVFGSAASKAEL